MKSAYGDPKVRRGGMIWQGLVLHGVGLLVLGVLPASSLAGTRWVSTASEVRINPGVEAFADLSWAAPDFDDSAWSIGQGGVGVRTDAPQPGVRVVADSRADWARQGRQGENAWVRGYYLSSGDPDGEFDHRTDFTLASESWSFRTGAWQLQSPDGLPLAALNSEGCEWTPEGCGRGVWVVQRWTASQTGRILTVVDIGSAAAPPAPDLRVYHNGHLAWELKRQRSLLPAKAPRFELELARGDLVDVACGFAAGTTPEPGAGVRFDFRVRFLEFLDGAPAVADSVGDWLTGAQGEGGWSYGFVAFPTADDTAYDPSELTLEDVTWNLLEGSWQLGSATNPLQRPPWDRISQSSAHPGTDASGRLRWVVRRWTSDMEGPSYARVNLRKQVAGGDGVTVTVCVNGVRKCGYTLDGGDTRGMRLLVPLGVLHPGDLVDFALDHRGLAAISHEAVDASHFEVSILQGRLDDDETIARFAETVLPAAGFSDSPLVYLRYPFVADRSRKPDQLLLRVRYEDGFIAYLNGEPVAVRGIADAAALADSIRDWREAGDEGADAWLSGWVTRTPGQGLVYDPTDMLAFVRLDPAGDGRSFWNGEGWDWPDGDPPWTRVYRETVHPNGPVPGPEHWAVRRWIAASPQDVLARIRVGKRNTACGDGVMAAVFRGAELRYSGEVEAWDGHGIDVALPVRDLRPGETIDFVVGARSDHGCDGTFMQATLLPVQFDPSLHSNAVEPREVDAIGLAETIDLSLHIPLLQDGDNVLAFHCFGSLAGGASMVLSPQLIANAAPESPGADLICQPPLDAVVSVTSMARSTLDADGDPLTVLDAFVPGPLVSSAKVGIRDGWIRYTPAPGFAGEETFRVVVADTGGLTSTGTVRVAVQADREDPSMLGAWLLPDRSKITLLASEPLDAAVAADSVHYRFPEPFHGSGVSVAEGAQSVTVTLSESVPPDAELGVLVEGLRDPAGNPMPAQTLVARPQPNWPRRSAPDQFHSLAHDSAIPSYHLLRISFGELLADYSSAGDYLNTGRWLRFADATYDPDGVPLYPYNGYSYNPTRTELHCLSMYGKYLSGTQGLDPFLAGVERLLSLQDGRGAFLYPFDYTHHFEDIHLTAGWSSGLAQGFGLSVLARAYHLTGDERYRAAGEAALDYLLLPMTEGGATTSLGGLDPSLSSYVWFEEWLVNPVPYTLNGFMFTLLGLFDWASLPGDIPSAHRAAGAYQDGIATLHAVLPLYDVGGFTTYDLRHLLLGRSPGLFPDYHAVHIGTLHALRTITQSREFQDAELRWASYVERPTDLRIFAPITARIENEWPVEVEVLCHGSRIIPGTKSPRDFMGDVLLDGLPLEASLDGGEPLAARTTASGLASFTLSPAPRYGEPTRVPVDVVFPGWGEYQASAARIHLEVEGSGLLDPGVTAGPGYVKLAWPASTAGWHDGYVVYRSENAGGPFARLAEIPLDASVLSYVDFDVVPGQAYYYRLSAVDEAGVESDFSSIHEITAFAGTAPMLTMNASPQDGNAVVECTCVPGETYAVEASQDLLAWRRVHVFQAQQALEILLLPWDGSIRSEFFRVVLQP